MDPELERLMPRLVRARAARTRRPASIEPVGPGEESVWDFPRPPRVEAVPQRIRVEFAERTLAGTRAGLRIVETAGAPVYFCPPQDVDLGALTPSASVDTVCEWKGRATYFDATVGDRRSDAAAFAYPAPLTDLGMGYERVAGWFAFYANRVDAAWLDDERVTPQPGGFYAGWVTSRLKGPIKGAPGSEGW